MPHSPAEPNGHNNELGADSEGVVTCEVNDAEVDRTVRPMSESRIRSLEKRGLIPKRPPKPEAPPTPPDKPQP